MMRPRDPQDPLEHQIEPEPQHKPEEDDTPPVLGKLPTMPLDVFPMPIESAIKDIAASKGVSPDMVGAFFLSLGSACIGRARSIRYKSTWSEAANLYVLVMAGSGDGKSHTQKFVFKTLAHMEAVQKARYQDERRKYEEDMILFRKSRVGRPPKKGEAQCPTEKNEMPKRPPNVQYMLDDATLEAAVELLYDNPRGMTWVQDEFYGFFQGLDRYNAAKGGPGEGKRKLLSAWDGRTISMSRKSKDGVSNETYVEKATFSICGCIQSKLIPEIFTSLDVIQGLPQRFLYVRTPAQLPIIHPSPEISDEVSMLISRITKNMLGLAMDEDPDGRLVGVEINMDEGAKKAFENFMNTISNKAHGTPMAGWASKIIGSTLRIALVLHYIKCASENDVCDGIVTFEDMSNAIRLADYFHAQARAVQMILPGEDGDKCRDVSDNTRKLASVLVDHQDEIVAMQHKVDYNEMGQWLKAAGIKIEKNDLKKCVDELDARSGRDRTRRYRLITPDVLMRCRQLTTTIDSLFDSEDE